MHIDPVLPPIVAAAFALLLIGLALRRLGQPHVVVYLLGGIVLGRHGLAIFTDEVMLTRVGDLGVVMLLFFVGMEVSLSRLLEGWRVAIGGTLLQILASVGCVAAVGAWLDWPWPRVLLLGFVVSISSTAVVISLLRSRGELDRPAGMDALGILLVQDLALVPMLMLISVAGGDSPSGAELARQAVGGVIVLGVLVFLGRRESISLHLGKLVRDDHELQVLLALVLCFGLATATGLLGLSTAVGAFLAGIVVASAQETAWVHHSLEPFRVVLVALFFVSVGMLVDLPFLAEHAGTLALLLLIVLTTNWLINSTILKAFGRSWRRALYVGALLAQVGEFSFVLASAGRHAGIIGDYGFQLTIGLIAMTLILSPLLASGARLLVRERA